MIKLKRNLLSVALASATLMLAGGVHAVEPATPADPPKPEPQSNAGGASQDEAKELDEVTVVGLRGSIERSINLKSDASTIVEAISAEDLGKLPDISIADSSPTRSHACRASPPSASRVVHRRSASAASPATTAPPCSTAANRSRSVTTAPSSSTSTRPN